MTGFKSFADKTLLTFEPGVTGVVGPNGSGKSNISDAVRWVMGEMSAKALRGGNMQDVIFAGTEKRKPLGYAQVSLTLDNSERVFNVDFDEVTVTRKVYRSGESEYSINGAQCRLKDIHELFMDTGLGRDGYSIIGQGKVSEIISGKTEERRNIIDEAAGISKYRHRREEAQRKLESTQENLVRIGDIVSELSGQIEPLLKQSEKAKKYLGLREELKKIDVNLFIRSIDRIKEELTKTLKDFNIVTSELDERQASFEEAEKAIERESALAEQKERELEQKRAEIAESEILIKGYIGDIEVLKNSISSSGEMNEKILKDIEHLTLRKESLADAVLNISAQKTEMHEKLSALKEEMAQHTAKQNEVVSEFSKKNNDLNALKSELIEKLNKIVEYKSRKSSYEAFCGSFKERLEAIEKERTNNFDEIDKINAEKKSVETFLDKLKSEASEMIAAYNTVLQKEDGAKKQKDELESKKTALSEQYNKKNSRLNMLIEMEKDFEGYNKSVKTVLSERSGALSDIKIHGVLSSLIETEKKYVTAVEIALAAAAQNVVVETEEDAKSAIEFLKKSKSGRVTFLPVSSVKRNDLRDTDEIAKCKGYVSVASELVSCDKKYDDIISSILGKTVVVDNIDNAVLMSKKYGYKFKVVTLDGELLNVGGAITGGSVNKVTGLLSRAGDIKDLREETKELKKDADETEEKIRAVELKIAGYEREKIQTDEKIRQNEQQLIKTEAELSHIEKTIAQKNKSDSDSVSEIDLIRSQLAESNDKIGEVINKITLEEVQIEQIKEKIESGERGARDTEEQKEAVSALISQKNVEINSAVKDLAALEMRADDIKKQIASIESDIELKREDISSVGKQMEDLDFQISEKEKLIEDARENLSQMTKDAQRISLERTDAKNNSSALIADSRDVRERIFALREEQSRIDARRQKLDSEQENITERMWDDYEITYITAANYRADIGSVTDAQKRASSLRQSIKSLGNVNVDAIEEYKNVKERYDFLSSQYTDLTDAKVKLEKLIESIQEKMKQQFKEQFEVINKHFEATFEELFGGGKAKLKLADPSDVLQSPIEIEAQPPGKKLQSLSLLSGGEMAFCAIALLFAILKVRPTPFCVLDEIEAALDEPNVYRFADYVKQYSKKTQFILVTHRRGTMEAADLLYGVTMQEKGVSKLLALKIDEAENLQ